MNRREAIARVSWIMGGAVVGAELFISGCSRKPTHDLEYLILADTQLLLEELVETILPTTDSPGAKEAGVAAFIPVMVRDCYSPKDQKVFLEGLTQLEERSNSLFKKSFVNLSSEEKTSFLKEQDQEASAYQAKKSPDDAPHYFHLFKQITLLGYFTSEVGMTQALRYVPVPGKYIGEYPYVEGEKAWAS